MRHAASLRLETAATHGSAFAASKSALSIHSYVDMGGVGPPSAKNRFSASTASADARNTHFVQSTLACNTLGVAATLADLTPPPGRPHFSKSSPAVERICPYLAVSGYGYSTLDGVSGQVADFSTFVVPIWA